LEENQHIIKTNEVLEGEIVREGDSFDVGHDTAGPSRSVSSHDPLTILLSNPSKMIELLGVTPDQADNIKMAAIAGGTGLAYKKLKKYVGPQVASVLGAWASTWLVENLFEGK
jgi:hypothetical protein